MPIPYMGSKRKSAHQIKNVILNYSKGNKEDNIFVDLFCGGFALGEVFLREGWRVIANDKNKYVIALLNQTINKGLDEKKCLEFVTREKFNDVVNNPRKYEDWYVGYVMCLWSFGNNQKAYLLGKNREYIYKKVYDMIVYKIVDDELKKIIPQKYIDGILKQSDWHKRRMAFRKVWNILGNKNSQLKSLESLQRLERLQNMESLERLERLQKVENLQSVRRLEIYSLDYRDVIIPPNAIVYCDPPYQGTAEYKEGQFNHKEFWDYIRNLSKTNKVFVSEYNAPSDFKKIYEFEQGSGLSSKGTTKNQPTEKIFTI